MIKTDYKRRILALLLTVALMLTLIPAMAVTVSAASEAVEDLMATLEDYGFTAVFDDLNTVTVTGNVGAEDTALWNNSLSLYIPGGITVDWKASVTGESGNNYWLALYGEGTFYMSGGLIEITEGSNSSCILIFTNQSVKFVLDGGTVRNACPNGYAIDCCDDSEYIYIIGTVEGIVNYGGEPDPDDVFFLTAGEFNDFLDVAYAVNVDPSYIYGISMLFASDDFPNVSGRFMFNDNGLEVKTFEFDFADADTAFNSDYWIEDYGDTRAVYIKSQAPVFDSNGSYEFYDLRTYCDEGSFHMIAFILFDSNGDVLNEPYYFGSSPDDSAVEDLMATLEDYGFTAVFDDLNTVTVTGNVGAEDTALWNNSLSLYIPGGITVDWKASVTGESGNNYWLALYGEGTFYMSGGLIEITEGSNSSCILIFTNQSVKFVLDGGTVRNACPNGYAIDCCDDSEYIYIIGTVEGIVNYGGEPDPDDEFFLTAGEYYDFWDVAYAVNVDPSDIYGISMLFASDDFPNVSGRFMFNDDGLEVKTFEFDFADADTAFNSDYWIEDYGDIRAVYVKSQAPVFDSNGSYDSYDLKTYCDEGSFHMIAFILLDSNGAALHVPYSFGSSPDDPSVYGLITTLENYGFTADYNGKYTVTVTGKLYDQEDELYLYIPKGIIVDWQAELTSSHGFESDDLISLEDKGTFLMTGGLIAQNDPDADSAIYLPSDKVKLIIDGGIVSSVGSYTFWNGVGIEIISGAVFGWGDNEDDVFNGGSYMLNDPAGNGIIIWWNGSDLGWTPSAATVNKDGDTIAFSYTTDYGTNQGTFNVDASEGINDIEDLIAKLEDYGFTADYDGEDTVTVTGKLYNQKDELCLYIPEGIIVDWQAELTSSHEFESDDLISLEDKGTFLMTGGLIAQNDPDADSAIYLPSDKVKLIIDGGIVSSVGSYTFWNGVGIEIISGAVFSYGENEEDIFNFSSYMLNAPVGNGIIIWWNGSDLGWTPSAATVNKDGDTIAFSYTTDYGTNQGTFNVGVFGKEILDIMVDTENNSISVTLNTDVTDDEVLIVALYAGGKLLEMKQIHQGDDLYVPVSYLAQADAIKAMWWNDRVSARPLCKAITIECYAGAWEK